MKREQLLREDKSGKPDFTYIAEMYPVFARIMLRLQEGQRKYARLNWRNCEDPQTYKESFLRHALQYVNGQTDEEHLVASIINGLILLDLEENQSGTRKTHTNSSSRNRNTPSRGPKTA